MSEADKPNFSEEQIKYLHSVTRESVLSGEEMGFNLLGDLKNPRFGEIQKGYEALMWIPKVSTSFGTFHTHPKARAYFSTGDIVSTLFKNQSVICIGGRGIKGVWTPKRATYYTEVVCYVAEPLSERYENLVKKREEYGSALSVGDWDKLKVIGREIYELGQKAFEKYTYGEMLMSEENPEKEEEKKPTLKELMTGKVLDGYVEAARVKPLTEFDPEAKRREQIAKADKLLKDIREAREK